MKNFQIVTLALAVTAGLREPTTATFTMGGARTLFGAGVVAGAPAAADLSQPVHYTATVVDIAGHPVPGATVDHYRAKARAWAPGENELIQSVTTGTKGGFELQLTGEFTLVVAQKPGLAPSWRSGFPRPGTAERFVLRPPGVLAGIAQDEAGHPVPEAEVYVSTAWQETRDAQGGQAYHYLSGRPARRCFSTRTTTEGRFRLEGFPTNAAADLCVVAPGQVLPEPKRNHRGPDTLPYRTGPREIKLVVVPAGAIEGRVVTEGRRLPVAGAKLLLAPEGSGNRSSEPVWSGADGTFAFQNLEGRSYRLRAVMGTNALPDYVADTITVKVEAGQTNRAVQVTASQGGFLWVRVRGSHDHQPLFQATVDTDRLEHQAAARTDGHGVVLFRLPVGKYRVSASKEAWHETRASVPHQIRMGQTNQVELELAPPSRITGVVRDPTGAPVAGLTLTAFPQYRANPDQIKTDAQGRFAFEWARERSTSSGLVAVLAQDRQRNLVALQDLEEETKPLELRLEPGLILAGRIEDSQGSPLPHGSATVFLMASNSGTDIATVTASEGHGRFEVRALPPNRRYSVQASANGYGLAFNDSVETDVETNRLELPPFILKVANQPLAGQVLNLRNEPAANVNVYSSGQGQPNTSVCTDAQGLFAFEGVCEGTLRISANQQGSHASAMVEAGDTNVVLILAARSSGERGTPPRPALLSKPLPDLAPFGLAAGNVPSGKPLLLCLFDCEQRPSRQCLRLLSEQYESLRQQGLTVVAVQATLAEAESLKAWRQSQPVPFPVGWVTNTTAKPGWTANTGSLPWLILTDRQGRVTAEGFALEELEAKIKTL